MKNIISGIGDNITDSGNKDTVSDITVVKKIETRSQAEIMASNERIKQMEQLQRKLTAKKTAMTKDIKKLEQAIAAFQKAGSESTSASLLKMKAKEVVKILDKLEEIEKEMESVSSSLQDVMCESEPNELKGFTPDAAMEKVEEDVDAYLEKHKKVLEDNEKIISEALEKNSQVITTSVTSVSVEQNTQPKDKFQSIADLRPKYLEKDANLLEVRS